MDKIHRVSCIDRRGRDTSLRGDVEVIFGEPGPVQGGHTAATDPTRAWRRP